jgi:dipeptidyl aminopeptidase/acylaminoacyl peptidase
MRPDDLSRFASVTDPNLHPDGIRIAFVVSRMDFDEDRYDRRVWLWDGAEARPFTSGPGDGRPRWSPDGTRLVFLRTGADEGSVPQVAVMPADGGEAEVLTDFPLGAREAEWSPDGSRLAVVGASWTDEWAGMDDDERTRHPRRVTRFGSRFDDLGWRHDRRSNVFLVDPDGGGDPIPLSDGDFHDGGAAWRPDGAAVAFVSARHDERGMDSGNQVWEVPLDGGEPDAVTGVGVWSSPSYRPDGVLFAFGLADQWAYPDVAGLWRLGDGDPQRVAGHVDRSLTSAHPPVAPPGPQWIGADRCLTVMEDAGTVRVVSVSTTSDEVADVAGGQRLVTGISPRPDGSAFAFTATSPTDPGELWWWEDGEERRLTGLNEVFRADGGLVEPEHFVLERDGSEIDVWVLLPPGEGPVPGVLNIHGGPATQYGFGFFDEFQVEAGAGYGVIACNPRGSSGRGRDFVRTPVGRWTEDRPPDLEDILAVLDEALRRHPRIDPDRLGIMGGSYGGFMTTRIIAVDHRFRCAVPERGLYSFSSFRGTSDIGYRFPRMYLGDVTPDDWETLHRAGSLARAHLIRTPCLILHSEGDLRCPIEQAEQLFAILAAGGVEVEMLRFPGGSHELSRSGKPQHRRERFEAILEWLGRHLADGSADVTT